MARLTTDHEAAIAHAIEVIEGRWRAAGASPADRRARMGDHLRELLSWARAYTKLPDTEPAPAQAIVIEESYGSEPAIEEPQAAAVVEPAVEVVEPDTPGDAPGPDATAEVAETVQPVLKRTLFGFRAEGETGE